MDPAIHLGGLARWPGKTRGAVGFFLDFFVSFFIKKKRKEKILETLKIILDKGISYLSIPPTLTQERQVITVKLVLKSKKACKNYSSIYKSKTKRIK